MGKIAHVSQPNHKYASTSTETRSGHLDNIKAALARS
jgi:hypothetical protein